MLKRIKELLSRRGKTSVQGSSTSGSAAVAASGTSTGDASPPEVHVGPRVVHRPIAESDLDPDAVKIVRRLTRFDHSAYLVGGCVRDLLLEHKPKDFDIGTSATPRQVRKLFRNCRIIGRRFRLAHIYFQNGKIIEVATFRGQSEEGDQGGDLLIRDDNQFGSLEEDALRRDFTINSLFYDLNNETVLDHADGLGDLRRRVVRTIGDPVVRFKEDPIRILRAVKFAARLDLRIESKTRKAIDTTRDEILKAAPPRILEEINRFCRGGAARRSFELLRELSILPVILPEVAPFYAKEGPGWSLLCALLDRVDRRLRDDGSEIATGTILAMLLLPMLTDRFGWSERGASESTAGLKVRELADEILHPLALRLRVARKDQELCRQILMTLHRLAPVRPMRRNARQGLLRRNCLPSALFVLGVVAEQWGGEFAEAHEHWSSPARSGGGGPMPEEGDAAGRATDETAEGPKRKRRRSRRRGSRRRGGASGETESTGQEPAEKAAASATAAAPRKPSRKRASKAAAKPTSDRSRPRVWDDDYFFAALPSVPEGLETQDGSSDRYGADRVAPRDDDDAPAASESREPQTPESEDAPRAETSGDEAATDRPPRRRRRRRRRGPRKPETDSGSGSDSDPTPPDED